MTFQGRRVLVVEDDMMIAMLVEDMLADLGCEVIGPASALAPALVLARAEGTLDAAILDVNLDGESVFPVADILRARGVPMIFCTGYKDARLAEAHRGSPVLRKPYRLNDLADALAAALSGTEGA